MSEYFDEFPGKTVVYSYRQMLMEIPPKKWLLLPREYKNHRSALCVRRDLELRYPDFQFEVDGTRIYATKRTLEVKE